MPKGAHVLAALTGATIAAAGTVFFVRHRGQLSGVVLGTPSPTQAIAGALATHIRHIRRYAFASSQDKSPIVGLTHASYALVLLDTAQELVGTDTIKRAGYDPNKLRAFITKLQDLHAENLKKCDLHLQEVLAIERAEGGAQTPGFVVA